MNRLTGRNARQGGRDRDRRDLPRRLVARLADRFLRRTGLLSCRRSSSSSRPQPAGAAPCSCASGPRCRASWRLSGAGLACARRGRCRSVCRRAGRTRCPGSTRVASRLALPLRARSFWTVRAAISLARFSECPWLLLFLTCSYCPGALRALLDSAWWHATRLPGRAGAENGPRLGRLRLALGGGFGLRGRGLGLRGGRRRGLRLLLGGLCVCCSGAVGVCCCSSRKSSTSSSWSAPASSCGHCL